MRQFERKVLGGVLVMSLFFCSSNVFAQSSAVTGDVNVFIGNKFLDLFEEETDENDDYNSQAEGGVQLIIGKQDWPVLLTAEFLLSSHEETEDDVALKISTTELNFGVKKIFDTGSIVRPFIGGGLGIHSLEVELSNDFYSSSEDEHTLGFWASGGAMFQVTKHFNLGLELKYSYASVSFDGGSDDIDIGGVHVGGLIGYHW